MCYIKTKNECPKIALHDIHVKKVLFSHRKGTMISPVMGTGYVFNKTKRSLLSVKEMLLKDEISKGIHSYNIGHDFNNAMSMFLLCRLRDLRDSGRILDGFNEVLLCDAVIPRGSLFYGREDSPYVVSSSLKVLTPIYTIKYLLPFYTWENTDDTADVCESHGCLESMIGFSKVKITDFTTNREFIKTINEIELEYRHNEGSTE